MNVARTRIPVSEEIQRERQEVAKLHKQQRFQRKLAEVLFGKEIVGKYPLMEYKVYSRTRGEPIREN